MQSTMIFIVFQVLFQVMFAAEASAAAGMPRQEAQEAYLHMARSGSSVRRCLIQNQLQ